MPGYFGLQMSLEVSQIFPIKEAIKRGADELWSIARTIRNSGSDISVERDLAEIFGRGMICSTLERAFKDTAKIHRVIPLADGQEVELNFGPGPTVLRALKERDYMATVIQLSFLGWTHDREQLADLIASSMNKRSELGLGNGIGDPAVDDIMKTLTACSSQTSNFNWSFYTEEIQKQFQASIPTYQYSADYTRLTPALFLGAMDCLYQVQRFEEETRIAVTNEIGSITLIVWAHYILGMNVSVTGNVSQPIFFGDGSKPHVTIEWTQQNREYAGQLFYPSSTEDSGPEMHLLDQDMQIVLRCITDENDRTDITGEDRHPLLGWGRTYLRRLLNTSLLTTDQDPIYEEFINLATALAVNASQRLDRDTELSKRRPSLTTTGDYSDVRSVRDVNRPLQPLKFKYWRVTQAAAIIFDGLKLDERGIEHYVDYLRDTILSRETCPTTFNAFLRRVKSDDIEVSPTERLLDQAKYLARVVLLFSNVVDVQGCQSIPLRMTDDNEHLARHMDLLYTTPNSSRVTVRPSEIFHALATFLSGRRFDYEDDVNGLATRENRFLFLYSDFGWSICFDTVGDKDPADITPQLVHVLPGTPTNVRTGKRKCLLRDGIGSPRSLPPNSYPLSVGSSKVPRCTANVIKRSEYWVSRQDEFLSTVFFTIKPSPEWRRQVASSETTTGLHHIPADATTFEECSGYRAMQEGLWRCHLTPTECGHHPLRPGSSLQPLEMGPDVVELVGWQVTSDSVEQNAPQRILVLLTRGDPGIRWCALLNCVRPSIRDKKRSPRSVMLRTHQFCEKCALTYVASQPGRWILVL
jgi:hypothetical protein